MVKPDEKFEQPRFVRAARQKRDGANDIEVNIVDAGKRFPLRAHDTLLTSASRNVRVTNRPARFPPTGVWPLEMRADMVAALLDFKTTHQLCAAIAANCAPRPTALRITGNNRELVWSREAVAHFVNQRHLLQQANGPER